MTHKKQTKALKYLNKVEAYILKKYYDDEGEKNVKWMKRILRKNFEKMSKHLATYHKKSGVRYEDSHAKDGPTPNKRLRMIYKVWKQLSLKREKELVQEFCVMNMPKGLSAAMLF